ncbi:unnamed protein product [Darwinula stevensoni]|uniref:Uncharacterized protein n=1 Tax=Darwinula stevensoni TaxID=69355 RepID=A0A7R9A8D6_9CRUS|nr:unnamed protein product [Darwinula stevensoni]CAG0896247.1 unnamed protein product [Darwinula stevensoni]
MDAPGAVPQTEDQESDKARDQLRQKGLEWNYQTDTPVPLETSSRRGVLESLSLCLTGSLLHLSLLQKLLGSENQAEPFSLLNSGADLLQRPIIILGEKLSATFLPQGGREQMEDEWRGILLFTQESHGTMIFIPIVPNVGEMWINVEKLPPVHGEGRVPSSMRKIFFRGGLDVEWRTHTLPLLWILDRNLGRMPPFQLGELHERSNRQGIYNATNSQ